MRHPPSLHPGLGKSAVAGWGTISLLISRVWQGETDTALGPKKGTKWDGWPGVGSCAAHRRTSHWAYWIPRPRMPGQSLGTAIARKAGGQPTTHAPTRRTEVVIHCNGCLAHPSQGAGRASPARYACCCFLSLFAGAVYCKRYAPRIVYIPCDASLERRNGQAPMKKSSEQRATTTTAALSLLLLLRDGGWRARMHTLLQHVQHAPSSHTLHK